MQVYQRILVIFISLMLVACGDSPSSKFMKSCKGSTSECKCIADSLSKKIDKKDFTALVDQLEQLDKEG